MILFDTDSVTHLSYSNANIRRNIQRSTDKPLAIPIVTRNEIIRGRFDNLLKAANEEELRKAVDRYHRAEGLVSSFVVVNLDELAIEHFGKLRKQKSLKKMGRADLLIACIALANDALLITRNTKDYKDVPRLRIANWVD